ncbi:cytochrome P450 [Tricladium varicosporioides]|nr:cytochrome P450 [Hymenoscyphus varicosporioides]
MLFLLAQGAQIVFSILTLVAVYLVISYLRSPLKSIPGPFVAKFTNLWRFFDTYGGRTELTQYILHERFGPFVRLGPNIISLSDPALLRTIYNARGDYLKSEFYAGNDAKMGTMIIENVFSTRSNETHAQKLKPISKFYKMSNLLEIESLVDETIRSFCICLEDRFIEKEKTCKMNEYLLFFAWDVIGQITFSKPTGYLEKGCDNTGWLHTAEKALDYFATVGQIPTLDYWLAKNPIIPIGPPNFDSAAQFCAQQSIARQQESADGKNKGAADMLDGFLELKRINPELLDDNGVVSALLVNIVAGSDTTAILLRSCIYFVLKNPRIHRKLQQELSVAKLGQMPDASYNTVKALPYLDAVIRESCRLHPGVAMILERIVPRGGLTLSNGTVLPPGTIVGMNPYVIHRNKTVFGQDADSFRPERWLRDEEENEEEYEARLLRMKETDLTFGMGNRVCFGKNVALLETYKIIAMLFAKYDMSFENPEAEWKVQNSWFLRQSDINIRIRRKVG